MLATFGVGEVLLSMLIFFLWIVWLLLLFRVFADIFASRDMKGGTKALWVLFVLLLPFLGVLVYLLARGEKMHQHDIARLQRQESEARQYIQDVAGTSGSAATELGRLAELKSNGVINDDEFNRLKAKVIG